ncbi:MULTISPECIES: TIGR03617 family F420-dependent LLM class oxidoreductase [Pseudofrankia]|uniref:TIGR03617 family F420-dependent LLM class oxidoreductase n=1 Tax=Pseudofrankia TaxID=2994363 RepID=UPI000234D8A8|nr:MULTISPECIES: TIGR03617 family F420-dependent LLM class oxidoreductase [Pseudofrankia]OHV30911.1 LLM class F420-dependent oxidoreductase [Pseudofrankia sp. EUN1h]
MKVDAIVHDDLALVGERARLAQELGFDGMNVAEVAHDPFPPLTLAAVATERIRLGTGIAVAFARSPMTLAVLASDLHRLSHGRFVLGIGSQIRPHITRRFSMPWSRPAARMREYVAAMRAIWASWATGDPLRFEGEFYQHTLMTPMFSHGPSEFGDPAVFVAAVGPAMTAVAGEVADGLLAHGFTTPDYLREVTLRHLERGLAAAGRTRADIEVSVPVFAVTGRDEAELAANLGAARHQLAFYGSTPAYRPVLEHHGWGELGDELHLLSKRGEWARMAQAVPREVVEAFAVVVEPAAVAGEIARRWGGLVDRVQIGLPDNDPERMAAGAEMIKELAQR